MSRIPAFWGSTYVRVLLTALMVAMVAAGVAAGELNLIRIESATL